jgi:hypothetical protein
VPGNVRNHRFSALNDSICACLIASGARCLLREVSFYYIFFLKRGQRQRHVNPLRVDLANVYAANYSGLARMLLASQGFRIIGQVWNGARIYKPHRPWMRALPLYDPQSSPSGRIDAVHEPRSTCAEICNPNVFHHILKYPGITIYVDTVWVMMRVWGLGVWVYGVYGLLLVLYRVHIRLYRIHVAHYINQLTLYIIRLCLHRLLLCVS